MIRSDSGLIFFLSPVASVIVLSATAEEINRAPPPLHRHREVGGWGWSGRAARAVREES